MCVVCSREAGCGSSRTLLSRRGAEGSRAKKRKRRSKPKQASPKGPTSSDRLKPLRRLRPCRADAAIDSNPQGGTRMPSTHTHTSSLQTTVPAVVGRRSPSAKTGHSLLQMMHACIQPPLGGELTPTDRVALLAFTNRSPSARSDPSHLWATMAGRGVQHAKTFDKVSERAEAEGIKGKGRGSHRPTPAQSYSMIPGSARHAHHP